MQITAYNLGDHVLQSNEHETQEQVRADYILQLMADATAAATDVPIRVLNYDALKLLPNIIYKMKDDVDLCNLYEDEYPEENYENCFADTLKPEQFVQFANILVSSSEKLFNFISKVIDDERVKIDRNLPPPEEIAKVEEAAHNTILQLTENSDYKELVDLRKSKILKLLVFLIPFIERKIWRTKTSIAPLFHELGLMEPLWRLLIICWIFKNHEKFNPECSFQTNTIDNAMGFAKWSLHTFSIKSGNHVFSCVTPPFFDESHHYNQYTFYVIQGIYFKFCFLAYFSLLSSDYTDRPEAEELVSALLRRNNHNDLQRLNKINKLKETWGLLLTTTFDDLSYFKALTNKEITLLSSWAVFLIQEYVLPDKPCCCCFDNEDEPFHLALVTKSFTNPLHSPLGLYAEIIGVKPRLYIGKLPDKESGFENLNWNDKSTDEDEDEDIWFKGSDKTKEKFNKANFLLASCFREFLAAARLHEMAYQSWRIGLLSDWLQRHFSSTQASTVDKQHLLGEIGRYVCRLLRELTRADIGTTIYQKDYKNNSCYLQIVADDSADPKVLNSIERRQSKLDEIRRENDLKADEKSYCYKAVNENRFIHIPENATDEVINEYPEHKRPKSIMLLPLHMEQRLLGIIEVKGSQANHFHWSQRLLLQQISSVLAPYFYRQQMFLSMSNINRWVLQRRSFDMLLFNDKSDIKSQFGGVCQELCQIFLCRVANIWLRSEDKTDKFVLMGCSDPTAFKHSKPSEIDQEISFTYRPESGRASDAATHFHRSLAMEYDEQGIKVNQGRLHIKDPVLFKVGRYFSNKPEGITNYHTGQSLIELYPDWVRNDPHDKKRQSLFEERKFKEIMTFSLTLQVKDTASGETRNEVIGFVVLQHDHFFNFSRHWRHVIRLFNDQIVISLEQIGFIKSADALIRRLILHDTKEEAIGFTGHVKRFLDKAIYSRNELQRIQKLKMLPDEALEKINKLQETYVFLANDIEIAKKSYAKLHEKIDHISNANVYAFLGIKPGDDQKKSNIDMKGLLMSVFSGFKDRIKTKGLYFDCGIDENLKWYVHEESLTRLLQNLLDNATKYSLEDTCIDICVDQNSLSVSNTCLYDANMEGEWPFASGKRGSLYSNIDGWGYGLCFVSLLCDILNWKRKFSHDQLQDNKMAKFTITINR